MEGRRERRRERARGERSRTYYDTICTMHTTQIHVHTLTCTQTVTCTFYSNIIV